MAIRDILIFAFAFGSLPFILMRPFVGVLVWTVFAYLSPHRLTWGAAFDFRFAVVIGLALLISVAIHRDQRKMVWTPVTYIWLAFFIWTLMTTVLAFNPEGAAVQWSRWWKINLTSLLTLLVIQSESRLRLLVWAIVLSVGFYGAKGGLFTILSGGANRVYGPPGTFLGENNAMALALIMVLPLMRFLQLTEKRRWVKYVLISWMVLTLFSILGSQSRGALLGIIAMAAFLILKSPGRLKLILASILIAPLLWTFMPESWHDRMGTIAEYQQDGSAMGRINAWTFAFRLALDHPVFGGGFDTFLPELFLRYAPDPTDVHDAHSIYFEILGEQGFVGLGLFLSLGIATYFTCGRTVRLAKGDRKSDQAGTLSSMLQVSFVGYAVAGAFLGLAYFDLVYHLIVIAVIANAIADKQITVIADSDEAIDAHHYQRRRDSIG